MIEKDQGWLPSVPLDMECDNNSSIEITEMTDTDTYQ